MSPGSSLSVNVPPPLSAKDPASFAYTTMKERLPAIVIKTIDFLYRQKKDLIKFGGTKPEATAEAVEEDAKQIIPKLTKLRKDLETNKSAVPFDVLDSLGDLNYFNDDVAQWNEALESNQAEDEMPRFFEAPWLLMESYLYRRIKQIFLESNHLKMFDPFIEQKQVACKAAMNQMITVAKHLKDVEKQVGTSASHSHPNERKEFNLFLQLALWANKADLSLSCGCADKVLSHDLLENIKESLDSLAENVLCDNMSEVWFKAQTIKDKVREASHDFDKPIYIDLVADNSGYEVFADLCLLHFLTLMMCPVSLGSSGVRFRLHLKRLPWYVSDTMRPDLQWLFKMMAEQESLKDLADRWQSFFDSEFWEVHDHRFWTLPHDYADMSKISPDLYGILQQSSLIVFKGDLNYRKLVGDRKWHILTPFRAALRGFGPAPLVALRTAKADVVVGIEDVNIYAKINNNELPRNWQLSGEFGLIQYFDPTS